MPFINGSDSPTSYSERKLGAGDDNAPWPLDDLVEAQRMECAGHDAPAIALELGRPISDVERVLGMTARVHQPRRPDRANVGFASMKGR